TRAHRTRPARHAAARHPGTDLEIPGRERPHSAGPAGAPIAGAVARSRRQAARRKPRQGEGLATGGQPRRGLGAGARGGRRTVRQPGLGTVPRERARHAARPAPDRSRGRFPDRSRSAGECIQPLRRRKYRSRSDLWRARVADPDPRRWARHQRDRSRCGRTPGTLRTAGHARAGEAARCGHRGLEQARRGYGNRLASAGGGSVSGVAARYARLAIPARSSVMIRILTVDDHQLLREGIAAVLESQEDMTLVAQASNGHEAVDNFRRLRPDVTLMDLRMPDMSGIEAITEIRGEFPDARIIVLTTYAGDAQAAA